MCGIFAWAGKNPKQFDSTQLNVLGIFNEKRGEHSCGIAVDGDISIGIDGNKVYRDFLANSGYDSPKKLPVVIGHTRHATFGSHTLTNAHPFGFGKNKDYYKFIGVHNGSLLNHESLAKEYGIDTLAVKSNERGVITKRTKIDSEVLLEIIYKEEDFKVLSKYNGAAALVFTDTTKPNVTYCYHGKSRKSDYLAEVAATEERPLYYYQESPTSLYISSIKSSLLAIGGTKDNVGEFDHNTVYKITDGNVETAEKTLISRVGNYQTGTTYGNNAYSSSCARHAIDYNRDTTPITRSRYGGSNRTRTSVNADTKEGKSLLAANIYKDTPVNLVNSYGNRIYMNKLRYYRTGHTITGIYTWIDTYGFYFLGETEKEADKRFFDIVNKSFYGQDFVNDPSKLVGKAKKDTFVPFVSTAKREIVEPLKFYLLDGVRVKTALDYISCVELLKSKPSILDWTALSHCAAHPVIDVTATSKRYDQQEIIMNDVPYSGIICPLGSEKIYTIVNGNCTKVVELDKPAMSIINDLDKISKDLEEHEENENKKNNQTALQLIEAEAEADLDRLEDDIEEMFKDSLRRFPGYIKRLKKYNSVDRGAEALGIMEAFIGNAKKLITIDSKEQ